MKSRKFFASVLAATLMLSSVPILAWEAPESFAFEQLSRDNVKMRIAVGSDIHIGRNADSEAKLKNAYDAFYSVDRALDAVAFVGDITDTGTIAQYETLMNIINGKTEGGTQTILAMGNHEFYSGAGFARFKEKTGQEVNKVVKINGINIITIGAPTSSGNYSSSYTFLKNALEEAVKEDPTAPIFVLAHHGVPNTAYVTEEWNGTYGKCKELMQSYPQVIHISGHSHSTLEDARSIEQTVGFTAIQDGTLGAYFENESGKVNPTTGSASTYPDNMEVSSQALMIDVDEDNVVTIRRMNLTTGEYMYEEEPWVIDTAKIVEDTSAFNYTNERTSTGAPKFNSDAEVTISEVTKKSMMVHFPKAEAATDLNNDMVHTYKIKLTNVATGEETVRLVFGDYYEKVAKDEWDVKITGLASDTTYEIAVSAITSFEAESSPILATQTVTTLPSVMTEPQLVLDIDYSSGNTEDALGHTLDVMGAATIMQDEELNKSVAKFNGNGGFRYTLQTNDYDIFTEQFTMETYFKMSDIQKDQCIFSNQQGAGMGFEVVDNKLEFWCNLSGGRKIPSTSINVDEWTHAVATYDGSVIKIYINGELVTTMAGSGEVTIPGPKYYFVGADTSSSGQPEFQMEGAVNIARLYGGVLDAQAVKDAYETATKKEDVTEPEEAIIDLSIETNGTTAINQIYEFTANEDVDLSELTIRYYFKKADYVPMNFWCDYAGMLLNGAPWHKEITGDVTGTWGVEGEYMYLDLNMNTPFVLEKGMGTVTLQTRFANEDWSGISEFENCGYKVIKK